MVFIFAALLFYASGSFHGAEAKELQAGVSPIVLELGTLGRGTSTVGSFFIVTSSRDELVVELDAQRTSLDFFRKPEYSGILGKVSEEDGSPWVFFPANPYVLKHENETLKTASGGSITDWKKVSFVLNVPKDAEPCNHAVQIRPNPYIAEEYGTAVNIVAITSITVKFAVEGECAISGRILDITQKEDSPDGNVEIDAYFQNTGTATVSAHAPSIAVYSENGTKIDAQPSGYTYVKPGEISVLSAKFSSGKFQQEGRYAVNATVHYGANSTSKEATITIRRPEAASLEGQPEESGAGKNNYFVLLILIIIVAAAYRIYKDDGAEGRKSQAT